MQSVAHLSSSLSNHPLSVGLGAPHFQTRPLPSWTNLPAHAASCIQQTAPASLNPNVGTTSTVQGTVTHHHLTGRALHAFLARCMGQHVVQIHQTRWFVPAERALMPLNPCGAKTRDSMTHNLAAPFLPQRTCLLKRSPIANHGTSAAHLHPTALLHIRTNSGQNALQTQLWCQTRS